MILFVEILWVGFAIKRAIWGPHRTFALTSLFLIAVGLVAIFLMDQNQGNVLVTMAKPLYFTGLFLFIIKSTGEELFLLKQKLTKLQKK